MSAIEIRNLNFDMYSTSFQELIEVWIETMHSTDNVVVIWNALNHLELLKTKGFKINETEIYDNKILTISVLSLDEAFFILKALPIESGPFVQVFSLGKFITDNIDK